MGCNIVEGGRARTRAPVAKRWPDWLVVLAFFEASRAVIHALGVIGAVCFVDDDTFTDKGIESLCISHHVVQVGCGVVRTNCQPRIFRGDMADAVVRD